MGKQTRGQLPSKAKQALGKAPEKTAGSLTIVATSSDYGAPSATPAKPLPTPNQHDTPSPTRAPSLDRTVTATAAAVSPLGDARMAVLLVALVAIAVAGGAMSARRRHF